MNLDELAKKYGGTTTKVASTTSNLASLASKYGGKTNQLETTDTYGAFFPAKTGESPLTAGLKAAGNLPSSAFTLAKGIGTAVLNPIDTLSGVSNILKGGVEKLVGGDLGNKQTFDTFTNVLKDRYGSLENLQRTATNDPVGFGSDVLGLITGGAGLVGKGAEVSNIISKTGQLVTKPIAMVAEKTGQGISSTAKFATSQATGLNPETISEVIKNPEAFKTSNLPSRTEITQSVADALDSRLQELGGLGKEYQVLRDTPQIVTVPEDTISSVLNKYGVKLDDNNQIITSAESRPLSLGDKNALQEFINNYGNERVLSSNSFLNTREALSNLARYDASKTNLSNTISKDLRATYDELGKTQIKGLKELDTQYAPERQLLGQLKKDIFTSKGELKDGAISKIANITGKGKENLLNRMKEIVPDIEQRVRVLKAVEDIERSSGLKVGTYARAGAGIFGATTGNIPVIIGAILAQPEIAVPLLKGYGYVGQKATPVLNALKVIANDVNNFRLPSPILNQVEKASSNFKAGMSIQATKNFPERFNMQAEQLAKEMANRKIGSSAVNREDTINQIKNEAVSAEGRTSQKFDYQRYFDEKFNEVRSNKNTKSVVPKTDGASSFPQGYENDIKGVLNQMERAKPGSVSVSAKTATENLKNEALDYQRLYAENNDVPFNSVDLKPFFDKKLSEVINKSIPRDKKLTGADAKIQEESIKKYSENPVQLQNEYIDTNGKIVNTDEARKLFADVGYNGINSVAVHEASSALAKNVFEDLIKTKGLNDTLAYAGGSGSGKTSAASGLLQKDITDAAAVLDGNMSSMKSADYFIKTSIKNNKYPKIVYVYRDPMFAWKEGVIKRMLTNPDEGGRVVPLSVFLDNTVGSYNTIKQLLNDSSLGIKYDVKLIDNSAGVGKQKLLDREKFDKISIPSDLKSKLLAQTKKLYEEGTINKEQYEALIK